MSICGGPSLALVWFTCDWEKNFTAKHHHLKPSKATGLDNINARLLRDSSDVIAQPLTKIMNASLTSGIVPWKEARVSPIYKSNCPTCPSNYRPISILPVCMKLFEKAIQKQLVDYLTDNSILCPQQSGFRKCHSTQTATIDVTDFILSNMDKGNLTGAVFIDLKKAFDTVDIETLLFKLQCLGINNTFKLLWFRNYLKSRNQCVQHKTELSEKLTISCGVPQGSILGPILFTVYINDIVQSVTTSKISLYADDTVLLYSAKSINDITTSLTDELVHLAQWFRANKLHLNISKCKWTIFGSKRRLRRISPPEICIENDKIDHVSSYKYLGVELDRSLTWEVHVDTMCKKLRQRLGVLQRVRPYLDEKTALQLYNALVMPIIDYCDVSYSSCCAKSVNKIDRLMTRGGKIVLGAPFDTPTVTVIAKLNWLTFRQRTFYHKSILMYKCMKALCPSYLTTKFEQVDHGYSTRQSSNLKVVRCSTNMGQRSFLYDGTVSWNSLPNYAKLSSSLNVFKSNVLKHIK